MPSVNPLLGGAGDARAVAAAQALAALPGNAALLIAALTAVAALVDREASGWRRRRGGEGRASIGARIEVRHNAHMTQHRAFLLYLVLFFAAWALRATVLYDVDRALPLDDARWWYSNAVKFVLWVVPAVAYVMLVRRRNPLVYFKLAGPIDPPGFAPALGVAALFFAGVLAFSGLVFGKDLAHVAAAPAALWSGNVSNALPSALWEEVLFRGLILTQLSEWFGFWRANLLTALLFMLIHWPYWLSTRGLGLGVVVDSVSVLLIGWVLGYVVKRTNWLWAGVAVHTLNNVLVALLG